MPHNLIKHKKIKMKNITILIVAFLIANIAFAQQGINYKAIISDNGSAIQNQTVTVYFTILEDGTASVYEENHSATTDNSGIVVLNIGEGTSTFGTFAEIDWSQEQFLNVQIDTGSGITDMGTNAFKAVPFAKYTKNSEKLAGKTFAEIKTEVKTEIDNEILSAIVADLADLKAEVTSQTNEIADLITFNSDQAIEIESLKTQIASLESSAFDGSYTSLTGKPSLFDGSYTSLTNVPTYFDGNYNNLSNKPTTISTTQANAIIVNSAKAGLTPDQVNDLSENSAKITALETKTASMSIAIQHGQPTVRFSGVNLQVVSGTGTTAGTVNGRGNLIVGYNALGATKTGSHNLIVGEYQNYSSYGGAVFGYFNTISKRYSSVLGGTSNKAKGTCSSVSGGDHNEAVGYKSSITGGAYNIANNTNSFIAGGYYNVANANYSSILGGNENTTSGIYSVILGGRSNLASGSYSSVSAGRANIASGECSSVSGGGGGIDALFGSRGNKAEGDYSTIGGGTWDYVTGSYNWRAGNLFEEY